MNIKLTIDRLEGEKAVLLTEDGQSIIWPKNKLSAGSKEGMIFNFNILNDTETKKNKEELAKEILNEILNTDE